MGKSFLYKIQRARGVWIPTKKRQELGGFGPELSDSNWALYSEMSD